MKNQTKPKWQRSKNEKETTESLRKKCKTIRKVREKHIFLTYDRKGGWHQNETIT